MASWLCPPHLRPPIVAIYGFARTADDIADEGDAPASARLADLEAMRRDLLACHQGQASARWPQVFGPLSQALKAFALPLDLLDALLQAFEQDVRLTDAGAVHADRESLLDYCRRSANPIGRLLLHLVGVTDARALALSDDVCSALQLINFWQDLSVDIPRGRFYLPQDRCSALGIDPRRLPDAGAHAAWRTLMQGEVAWARALMDRGAPLVHQMPGRMGWELRLVVQGARVLTDKMAAMEHATWAERPTLRTPDLLRAGWRSLWM